MLIRATVTAVVYLAAARYSILLHDFGGSGAVFWPGAGVTVTALLVSPRRSWPAIVGAVAVAEAGNDLQLGFAAWPAGWWGLANALEPLVAATLIQRWGASTLADVPSVVRFALATVAATSIGALVGAVGTEATTGALPYAETALQWLIGDSLGILTVVPCGLVLFGRIPAVGWRSLEAVLALLAVGVTSVLIFGSQDRQGAMAADYLIFLPMVWAAVRLRVVGAAVTLFVVAEVANAMNALDRGPFAGSGLSYLEGSAQLQIYLATVGITVLMLASRTVESETFQDLADARERLIAAVSHELRTPLTSIVGFSELLLRREPRLAPRTRQGLEVIHRNGQHLTALVEDLLRASRAKQGSVVVHPEAIELVRFVDELLVERRDTTVVVTSSQPEVTAWVDRTHLVQIVTNLLDNAARHGRPPVQVSIERAGHAVELAVSDDGLGVPDWFVPQLFVEFAQATVGDRRPSMGLELGLPIAQALAHANGGDLAYRPSERGASFVVRVPVPDV